MSEFRPLGDRVLVLPRSAPVKEGGLAVPGIQADKATQGTVVAVGDGVRCSCGLTDCPAAPGVIKVGDRVQFGQYAGRKAMHNGVEHKLLRLEELEGVIEDDEQTDSQR